MIYTNLFKLHSKVNFSIIFLFIFNLFFNSNNLLFAQNLPNSGSFYHILDELNHTLGVRQRPLLNTMDCLSLYPTNSTNQWKFVPAGNNYYKIVYENDCGLYLTDTEKTINIWWKNSVELRAGFQNDHSQQWSISSEGDKIKITNRKTKRVLYRNLKQSDKFNCKEILAVDQKILDAAYDSHKSFIFWKIKPAGLDGNSFSYIVPDEKLLDYDIRVFKSLGNTNLTLDARKWLTKKGLAKWSDFGDNSVNGNKEKPNVREYFVIPDNVISYEWIVKKKCGMDTSVVIPIEKCKNLIQRPFIQKLIIDGEGFYTSELKIKTQDLLGNVKEISSGIRKFQVQDIVIASMGDSYASGEGVPDKRGYKNEDRAKCEFATVGKMLESIQEIDLNTDYAEWVEPRAHRSNNAAPALATEEFVGKQNEKLFYTATFIHVASSGAKIEKGLLENQRDWEEFDLRDDGQIFRIREILKGKKIDFLLISIGGNDVGFVDALKNFTLKKDPSTKKYYDNIEKLGTAYWELNEAIEKNLNVDRILITEYPTGIFNNDLGEVSGGCGLFDLIEFYEDESRGSITAAEARSMSQIGRAMNRQIAKSAKQLGWTYVDGISRRFDEHGYCACNPFFVGAEESCEKQGDFNGTMHPNLRGQKAAAEAIVEKMRNFRLIFPPQDPCIDGPIFATGKQKVEVEFSFKNDFPELWNTLKSLRDQKFTARYHPISFNIEKSKLKKKLSNLKVKKLSLSFKNNGNMPPMAVGLTRENFSQTSLRIARKGALNSWSGEETDKWKPLLNRSPEGKWNIAVPNIDIVWKLFESGAIQDVILSVSYEGKKR